LGQKQIINALQGGKNVGKIFEILPTELRLTVGEVLPDVAEAHF